MQIIQSPPPIHTAFNPALLVIQSTAGATEVDITINNSTSFTAEFFNGTATVNIANYIKKLFRNETVIAAEDRLFTDCNLRVDYNVMVAGVGEYRGIAVNAAAQIGETSDLTTKRGKFLTTFNRLKKWEGFPLNVSAIGLDSETYIQVGGAWEETLLCEHISIIIPDGATDVALRDGTASTYLRTNRGEIIRTNTDEPIFLIEGSATREEILLIDNYLCADRPFYIRWINQQGGWDYWMFSFRQFISRNVQNQQTFNPFVDNQENAKGFTELINQDGIEQITVGASGLNENEYEAISKLIYSPRIEYYDKEKDRWFTLIVDSGENENDTRLSGKSLEFTFDLPTPQLQF